MEETIKFPINPFEDVKPQDFNKLNKKHVTEDFVEENFKYLGWETFKPFNDTGIDRIVIKNVCPKGHTPLNKSCKEYCEVCNSKSIEIIRFIQVKTRSLKNNIFGFTLKPKDVRIDPRHIYLLYCDSTQDFLILNVKDYLLFFLKNDMNPFSATSFRKGNNKMNSLKYNQDLDKWSWGKISWEEYRNLNGLKNIQNPVLDKNLKEEIKETKEISEKLLKKFNKGGTYSEEFESKINLYLKEKSEEYSYKENILKTRSKTLESLKKEINDPKTFSSIMKYWEIIKNLEIKGEDVQTVSKLKEEIKEVKNE